MSNSKSFNLSNVKIIEIGGQKYELKYPSVGQIIDIDNKKMLLSNGEYSNYVANPIKTRSLVWTLDLIDTISHFIVLIPNLPRELKLDSFLEVDPITAKELVRVYKQDFLPWYQELMKFIHDETVSELESTDSNAN
jgi:hypothetical protein